ncbi:MAG: sigma factor-like helix-turn-helix DNA-binding protein [Polyangiales bacterium]
MTTMGPIEVSGRDVAITEEAQMGLAYALELTPVEESDDSSTRKPRVRARTISIKRLSKRELERGRMLYPEVDYERPQTRADCLHGPHAERPCPFVSCKHHLYLDVNERTGSIKVNFPDAEVWDLPETCALDIADRGGITLEEVGEIMNLTRERIRQLETRGLAKLKALGEMASLSDYCDE